MLKLSQHSMASMNYFDFDMPNSTNTVIHFDGKSGNLYLRLRARSHTVYEAQVSGSLFQTVKVEQMNTQHTLLRRESLN